MPKTYKLTYTKRLFTRNPSKKWIISGLCGVILGIGVGSVPYLIREEADNDKTQTRAKILERSLTAYKALNSILFRAIALKEEFDKTYFSNAPEKEERASFLKSELKSMKTEFSATEKQIAKLENREERDLNVALVLPEQCPSGGEVEQGRRILVKGKVTDPNGSPAAGVQVRITDSYEGVTNQDGEYIIESVPKGRHFIQAFWGNETSPERRINVEGDSNRIDEIVFPAFVEDMLFCKEIQKKRSTGDRTEYVIIGSDDEFQREVGKVVCFTKLVGLGKNTKVEHRWFWKDELLLQVPLEVRADNWRTYSSKQILPEQVGTWRVEVAMAGEDTVLASRTFNVR
jgi:hypothetical protein